jgi:hypothetical protein
MSKVGRRKRLVFETTLWKPEFIFNGYSMGCIVTLYYVVLNYI